MVFLISMRKYLLIFMRGGLVFVTVVYSIRLNSMQNTQGHAVSSD